MAQIDDNKTKWKSEGGAEHSSFASMGDLMTFDNVRDRILIKFGIWMRMPLERIMDLKLSLKHERISCFFMKKQIVELKKVGGDSFW
mgnify:CR=1 FL=1